MRIEAAYIREQFTCLLDKSTMTSSRRQRWLNSLFIMMPILIGVVMVTASKCYLTSNGKESISSRLHSQADVVDGNCRSFIAARISEAISIVVDQLTIYKFLIGLLLTLTSVYLYRQLFQPYIIVRRLGDIGYISGSRNKKDVANEIRKRRRIGDVPPVYPNGWFSVLRSRELNRGDVKYVSALGEELAVYRGENGQAYIIDAYCPHQGANLGVGGQVKGDCIECPFHGWIFTGSDGKCVDIPYSEKVPEFAKTKVWRSLEVNGEIFIWYHAESEEPGWFPPVIEGIESGELNYHGYTEHYINAHIEEIPENAADLSHLKHLHKPFVTAGRDLRHITSSTWDWIRHDWNGNWSVDEDNKHIGTLSLRHSGRFFGDHVVPLTEMTAEAQQIGPGIVHLYLRHPVIGNLTMVQTVIPIEPLVQRLVHVCYTPNRIPRPLAKIFLYMECIQVERDLMIWNHKTYRSKPKLVKEESLVVKHRRWFSQFYTENSPRYSTRKEGLDW